MTILRELMSWRRERPPHETRNSSDLTPWEQANVRAALRALRGRFGSTRKLADAMRAKYKTIEHALGTRRRITGGLAIRVARTAGVAVDDVLNGTWPKAGACSHCGRGG